MQGGVDGAKGKGWRVIRRAQVGAMLVSKRREHDTRDFYRDGCNTQHELKLGRQVCVKPQSEASSNRECGRCHLQSI